MTLRLANYINGKFLPPSTGRYLDTFNPSTNEKAADVPDSNYNDVESAVRAAKEALVKWRETSFVERAELLNKIGDTLAKRSNEFIKAESGDMGKPVQWANAIDIPTAVDKFKGYARQILVDTQVYHQNKEALIVEHRDPIGVVGLITPWNFPLMILSEKISAAIACGNTCVCKPSELSPITSYLLCKVFEEVGVPPGVINVVHGYGPSAGQPIVEHRDVRGISFTGGSVTGRFIQSHSNLKKLQLELGGKNPAIVFDDCYFDETVQGVAFGGLINTGQVCCSGSRVLVQRTIFDKFVNALVSHVKEAWTAGTGNPLNNTTVLGPLVSKQHFEKVSKYIQLAKEEGGTFVLGGDIEGARSRLPYPYNKGNFIEPTIVLGLKDTCRCAKEEIFGPVITIHPFDTEEEAIKIANDVEYGLAAVVWTSDARRTQRVARQLEAGTIWVNCYFVGDSRVPFGGYKASGIAREGGKHSIEFFTETKAIVSKL